MAPTRVAGLLGLLLLGQGVLGSVLAPTPVERVVARQNSESASAPDVTELTDCHAHDDELWCMAGEDEFQVDYTATGTEEPPASFTDCHSHSGDMFCVDEDGQDVAVMVDGAADDGGHEGEDDSSGDEPSEENCHFHAGVEHCVGAGESESGGSESGGSGSGSADKCEKVHREYDVPLRIGLIFAMLGTSALGVFAPIFLMRFLPNKMSVLLILLKQFGTGIIISTAFVHLFVHAMLMFQNECIEGVNYEGTAAAICMAGIFVSFLIEYFGHRYMHARLENQKANACPEDVSIEKHCARMEVMGVHIMEAGIIFHSAIIGVTLVVAGDSFFLTLFIVIVFHQFFEGLALGSRIAELGTGKHYALSNIGHHHHHDGPTSETDPKSAGEDTAHSVDSDHHAPHSAVSMWHKCALAAIFAVITPIGMAIGTGVLSEFNGNDASTAIAIGTLDAFSAGILVWVGVVEMWAGDWMHGEMAHASKLVTTLGIISMMAGMALMSLLGKWA